MDNSGDSCNIVDRDGEADSSNCSGGGAGGAGFKLFNRPGSVHLFMGGGKGKNFISLYTIIELPWPEICFSIFLRKINWKIDSLQFNFSFCFIRKCWFSSLAADLLLWKRRRVSFGVIVVATVAWLIFERSGLPFLSVCADVLLLLIVLLFLRANYAAYRNKYAQSALLCSAWCFGI